MGHEECFPLRSAVGRNGISFKGYRFPPDVISYAVWLYTVFR